MPDARSFDYNRGREIGEEQYRPEIHPSTNLYVHGGADFAATAAFGLRVGMFAARLNPSVEDHDDFLEGMLDGAEAARVATVRSHSIAPGCAPDAGTMCEYCRAYHEVVRRSIASRAEWEERLNDPEAVFALGGSKSMIHDRKCSAVTRIVSDAQHNLDRVTPNDARHGGASAQWPTLLTRAEAIAANRKRCRVCVPDLPERTKRGTTKGADGRFKAPD